MFLPPRARPERNRPRVVLDLDDDFWGLRDVHAPPALAPAPAPDPAPAPAAVPAPAANAPTQAQDDALMEEQAAYTHVPMCAVCMGELVDKDEEFGEDLKIVAWRECGHAFHAKCLEGMHGPLPRNGAANGMHQPMGWRVCPKCPLCQRLAPSCQHNYCGSRTCNPVHRIYLSGGEDGGPDPIPFKIIVNGETSKLLNLAAVAHRAGVDVEKLKEKAAELINAGGRNRGNRGNEMAVHSENLKKTYKQLEELVTKLQEEKANSVLPEYLRPLTTHLTDLIGISSRADRVATLEGELSAANNLRTQSERNLNAMITEMADTHAREVANMKTSADKQKATLTSEVEKKGRLLKTVQDSLANWQTEYGVIDKQRADLDRKVKDVESQNRQLTRDKESVEARHRELTRHANSVDDRNLQLVLQKDALDTKYQRLTRDKTTVDARNKELQREKNADYARYVELIRERNLLETKNGEIEASLEQLRKELAEQKKERDKAVKAEVEKLMKTKLAEAHQKIAAMEAANSNGLEQLRKDLGISNGSPSPPAQSNSATPNPLPATYPDSQIAMSQPDRRGIIPAMLEAQKPTQTQTRAKSRVALKDKGNNQEDVVDGSDDEDACYDPAPVKTKAKPTKKRAAPAKAKTKLKAKPKTRSAATKAKSDFIVSDDDFSDEFQEDDFDLDYDLPARPAKRRKTSK